MRFRLSRGVVLALVAAVDLARSSRPWIAADRLAADNQLPPRFLAQVLQALTRAGVLRSVRGAEGGYALARAASQISVWDLVAAVEGESDAALRSAASLPADLNSRLAPLLAQIDQTVQQELTAVTLADLAGLA